MSPSPVALVTGAGRRIGAAIAQHLHQAGFNVLIHANHAKFEATKICETFNQQRPNSAELCFADLAEKASSALLIEKTLQWRGQLNLLVNNASLFIRDSALEPAETERLFNVNVKAPYALSMGAYPYLSVQKGAIINLTDIHAFHPLKDYLSYCQTKAALSEQTVSLAKQLAPNVRVNAIAPGAIAWPEGENALSSPIQKKIIDQTPLKRHGHPQDIAQTVLFLAQQAFITGQIINVDGGRHLVR